MTTKLSADWVQHRKTVALQAALAFVLVAMVLGHSLTDAEGPVALQWALVVGVLVGALGLERLTRGRAHPEVWTRARVAVPPPH